MEGGDSISLKGVPLLGRPICGGIEEGAHLGHGGAPAAATAEDDLGAVCVVPPLSLL